MQLFGHRGAAGEAPENTIAAARHAISRGTRRVEIDLRLSSDNQLVVVHDNNAERTAGVKQAITRLSTQQLSQLDARKFGTPWPRKTGCGIPTLKRYLNNSPEMQFYQLEVKSDQTTDIATTIDKLSEQFPSRASAKKIVVTSFDYDFLAKLKQQSPHLRIGAITYKAAALKTARDLGCDFFCIHRDLCKPALVKKVRETDMHLSVWTVNNPDTIKTLFELKVDSIISDYPSMALPLINRLKRT